MDANKTFSSGEGVAGDTWYVDNYILLKEYFDMTVSRIAARCIRSGNIAMEEYKHYAYILDVLEEISETGDYIILHKDLYPYVEKKIPGGIKTLQRNLQEFKTELQRIASPDMIKQDPNEIKKMKDALGGIEKSEDPTSGAGMSMDDVVKKLMKQNNIAPSSMPHQQEVQSLQQTPQPQAPRPQAPQSQAPRPQAPQSQASQQVPQHQVVQPKP